jgi:glycosyltransferase involved in cell wall biosynthesis
VSESGLPDSGVSESIVPGRLRIALLTDYFGRRYGGAEAYAVNLFEILAQRHDVTVISHDFDHDLPVREIRIAMPSLLPSWVRVWIFSMQARSLMRAGYDIVHSQMSGCVGDVEVIHVTPIRYRRLFGRSLFKRIIAWLQPSNIVYFLLEAASVRPHPGRHVVAVSPWLRDRLHDAYGPHLNLEVIPPGARAVPMDRENRQRVRQELGWGDADIGVLLVARNPLRKGFDAVLEALAQLPEHFRLAVIGADPDVEQYLLERFAALAPRVTLIAPVSAVTPYYQAADVYVHPTLMDSFGMAPLEAMAHGLPVVVSGPQYCGFSQYVTHMHDAWVLEDPKDPVQIAKGICELGTSAELRASFLLNSALLVERLSWDQVAAKFESLYADCITCRPRS